MVEGGKEKAEARLLDAARGKGDRRVDTHAECFEKIRAAAAAADRAVSMFRHTGAAGRGHETREGRDVECAETVAARTASVDETVGGNRERGCLFAKGAGEAEDFSAVLAAHPQGAQKAPGLRGGNVAAHQGEGRFAGITLGKGTVNGFVEQR